MRIKQEPINDGNREAVLALSVREDQPFVAPNDVSLRQADEANAEYPGAARPFAIYVNERLVGFCLFVFNPEEEDEDDRYWLWRFMIDKSQQGKGYGQAALQEIIKYFKENGADRLFLSTEPLGLKRTGFFQPLDEELVANAAFGFRLAQKEDTAHGYHYYPEHAAAGLWTTPTELVKIGIDLSRSYRKGETALPVTAERTGAF